MIYSNILETIGNTPSIKIRNININDTNIYIKAEFFNPASSIKDRLAISIIENAESN
jgi:cysteine synthase A